MKMLMEHWLLLEAPVKICETNNNLVELGPSTEFVCSGSSGDAPTPSSQRPSLHRGRGRAGRHGPQPSMQLHTRQCAEVAESSQAGGERAADGIVRSRITPDSYFTSVSLANELKKRKTRLVETLNIARREVPSSVTLTRDLLHTTILLISNDTVLTSYQGKVTKNVLVLSTLHTEVNIDQQIEKMIPEIIKFYNGTKYGVDIVDQMTHKYTTRAMSRRWPVHVFYNILDLACINAHTHYKDMLATTNVYSAKYPCVTKIKPETNVHSAENQFVEYEPAYKEEYAKSVTSNSGKKSY
ncbi:hypothetical protein PR048_025591 [Dryococelus australis]|uniref:PiggyBac transposable element-derived protein domain-containing protein n=1 Tax=Dryococelus australis TaxID=614101 RepID=A0ABQ9GRU7_9NEOP|nr:hypothetical protein PR048_025591 [Dryococelus australis]